MIRSGCASGKDSKTVNQKKSTGQEAEHGGQSNGDIDPHGNMKSWTDAVLSCPSCMTTLCLDCQQHDVFKGQFRAMFAMNVLVACEPTTHLIRSKNRANESP